MKVKTRPFTHTELLLFGQYPTKIRLLQSYYTFLIRLPRFRVA
jgi:hypothetical protein